MDNAEEYWITTRGVTRLDGAQARSKFGAPMFELGVFRKQTLITARSDAPQQNHGTQL